MDSLIVASILGMGGLGFFFAAVLAAANARLKVKEDPRIAKIEGLLPGVNCGVCGFLNCQEFAKHLASNTVSVDSCKAGGEEVQENLAALLGIELKIKIKKKAVVHCAADNNTRKRKAQYFGAKTCAAKNIVNGGEVLCEYACLGEGDCMRACPFDAIRMVDGLPRIILDKCTACGKCVEACPRDIISLEEVDESGEIIYVDCSSRDSGAQTVKVCSVGCIACGICEKLSQGAFQVKNNLSIPDYKKLKKVENKSEIMLKCPTKVIKFSKKE